MSATAQEMVRVATKLWGEVNRAQSSKRELRFGHNGSKSVDLGKLQWFDHEVGEGGGYRQLCERAGEPVQANAEPGQDIVSTYDYRDEAGQLLFQVVRKQPKRFAQRRPDPVSLDGWVWNLKGVRRVLYRLPELLAADPAMPVFVVEGEKDANALATLGLVATTNPGGASKWRADYCEHLRDRNVVILPDNDQAGRAHAADVGRKLVGTARSIRVITLPDLSEKNDVSDWLKSGGTAEALLALVRAGANGSAGAAPEEPGPEPAPEGDDDVAAEIARLARLPVLKYEQQRQAAAKLLGVRASILDLLVKAERGDGGADTKGQGRKLELELPTPWPEPIDGAELLEQLSDYFRRHLVLPEGGAVLLALWSIHTFCFTHWRYTPRLHIAAPVKNSGKSRVLALVRFVAAKPLRVENITPAAVFRAVEAVHPTLLIDECDMFLPQNPELVGILNGGHERGAQTIRAVAVGEEFEPRAFDTFSPTALAGIGRLPGPLESRCITLMMKLARRSEMPQDIGDATETRGAELGRRIARWVADHRDALLAARPDTGDVVNRARDNWIPLCAIAVVAGGEWPRLVREAMLALASADDDADSLGERLLSDIRDAFQALLEEQVAAGTKPTRELASEALVERLVTLEGRPWAEMGKAAKPLTKNRLARLLKPFGVIPGQIGPESARLRGYSVASFVEAFERHLPAPMGSPP